MSAAKKQKLDHQPPQHPENEMMLRVKKISENAAIPFRASKFAAGYDLVSAYDMIIPARGKGIVKTDLIIAVPEGCYGRVGKPFTIYVSFHNFFSYNHYKAPRSSLAVKNFVDVGAGVIDADYRGNVGVVLFNHSEEEFKGN